MRTPTRRRVLSCGAGALATLSFPAGLLIGLGGAKEALAQAAIPFQDISPGTPGLAVGIDALRWQDDAALQAEFDDYVRLGVRWLRTDLRWDLVQAEGPDHYDWSTMDNVVSLARQRGIRVLPVVGYTPAWARSNPEMPSPPADVQMFARFLVRAVKRYRPAGVRAWEVWNEPNMAMFWPPAPDPVLYASLLRASYAAIKNADPEARVLLGGLAPAPETGPDDGEIRYYGAADFLARVYAEAPEGPFDVLAFHPYSFPRMPDDPAGWSGWSIMTGPIRRLMADNGDVTKQIWLTEYGAPTFSGAGGISEDAQGAMLAEAFRLAQSYPWAGPLFWYSYRDLGSDPEDKEDWFGLVRSSKEPKPSYAEFEAEFGLRE